MKVAVIGSGIMGNGIAQVMAMSGYETVLVDVQQEALDRAKTTMEKNIGRVVDKQGLETTVEEVMQRVQLTTDIQHVSNAEVVVEAIVEKMEAKKALLQQLDEVCEPKTIFASNTSSLSVTEMGAATKRPDKVAGMHFFNPVPVMELVELVKGADTSDETMAVLQRLTEAMNKQSILVNDAPLFVVNRILIPMLSEAMFVYEEGIASAEDIDQGMKLGTNQPIGPLRLADMIGLDTLLAVQQSLLDETGDSKYRIPFILKKLVRAGHYGRKTGRGFYQY
ncbi:3-hydroxybutyryl-CoA dehydrogenase [Savagea sp. SN6]|uniref:3-hydroxybutyryl-CoA dehydrogenase n=1 Tax=Savagea serpentis TaxID=2785297 RepID=A0A8J7G2T7_9BACL|nr:3-hydroxyacyl-CoA dehydrogenase NAD-binding domain-containing protein [Savagea serpentis]MBF4501145.1 3-hydroxybutyryl-CoA dehydrogenase [Savagea serpentis]